MQKFHALAFTIALGTGAAYAQEQVTRTESSSAVQTQTSVDGAVQKKTTTSNVSTTYETRLQSAYEAAGLSAAEVERLRALDIQAREARRANEPARVKTIYQQQTQILPPAQREKVVYYLRQHPAPAQVPAYEVTTWEQYAAPGAAVTTPIGGAAVGVTGASVGTPLGGAAVGVTGARVDTPLGSIGIGAPADPAPATVRQETTVERTTQETR